MSESSWGSRRDEVFVEQDPRSDAFCDEGPRLRAEDSVGRVQEVEVESPEQRAARLADLRSAIESGAYRIPAESVAAKVMKRMRSQPSTGEGGAAEERSAEMLHATSQSGSARAATLRKPAKRSDS